MTLPAQHTTFNALDNWAIKTPPNQKGKGPEEKKGYRPGHGPEHVYNTLGYMYTKIIFKKSKHLEAFWSRNCQRTFWGLPKSKMLTLSGILRCSTWPTKCCKKILSAQCSDIRWTFTTLFMPFCCFIAFSKHVKLYFRSLSGFVTPLVKMLEGGWGILESPCLCVRLYVYLSAGFCPADMLWTAQPFVSKPDTVVHRPDLVCHAQ